MITSIKEWKEISNTTGVNEDFFTTKELVNLAKDTSYKSLTATTNILKLGAQPGHNIPKTEVNRVLKKYKLDNILEQAEKKFNDFFTYDQLQDIAKDTKNKSLKAYTELLIVGKQHEHNIPKAKVNRVLKKYKLLNLLEGKINSFNDFYTYDQLVQISKMTRNENPELQTRILSIGTQPGHNIPKVKVNNVLKKYKLDNLL